MNATKHNGRGPCDCSFTRHLTENNIHVCKFCGAESKADIEKYGYQNLKMHLVIKHTHD